MVQSVRAPSLSQQAYTALRRDLVSGVFEPATKLMISDLQGRYKLGAMPLREALNRLSAEQIVEKTDQRGFFVPALHYEDFFQIQNARIVIESAALRESVVNRTIDWEDRMVVCMHRLERAGPAGDSGNKDFIFSEAWADSHRRFHTTLISGSTNPWLLSLAANLFEQSARYRMRRPRPSSLRAPTRALVVEEHSAILDAALAGDAETAADRLVEHYRYSLEIVSGHKIGFSDDKTRFVLLGAKTPS